MTNTSKAQQAKKETLSVTTGVTRRTVVKGAAIAGAGALAAPVFIKDALAASELNILMWSDYLPDVFVNDFAKATGIKINHTGVGSNEEIINKMKANKGQGFDIISPTNNLALEWKPLELLQPYDLNRVPLGNVNAAMSKIGQVDWNFNNKGAHWLPSTWGTEGIAWRTDKWAPSGSAPSYGDVWSSENAGKTMGRPHSMMLGAGLYMETIGQLNPGDMWKAYKSEADMRPIWSKVTSWTIARKNNIKLLWNDADTQKNGLLNEGVIVGQTWDGPPLTLKTAGEPVMYQAPKEGSLAWVDGMAIPIGAKNIDEIYTFIKFAYDARNAGKVVKSNGYNSAVLGADNYAGAAYKKNFADAYPGNALSILNPWPAQAPWYSNVRTEYVNKFKSA